jgi:hypothetical protein
VRPRERLEEQEAARAHLLAQGGEEGAIEESDDDDEVEVALRQALRRHVATLRPDRQPPRRRLRRQPLERDVGHVDRQHVEAGAGERQRVPPAPARDVERAARRSLLERLDEPGRGRGAASALRVLAVPPLAIALVHPPERSRRARGILGA